VLPYHGDYLIEIEVEVLGGDGRDVREKKARGGAAERGTVAQGFGAKDIQCRAAKAFFSEGEDKGIFVDGIATPDIADKRMRRKKSQTAVIQNVVGGGIGRKHQHKIIGGRQ